MPVWPELRRGCKEDAEQAKGCAERERKAKTGRRAGGEKHCRTASFVSRMRTHEMPGGKGGMHRPCREKDDTGERSSRRRVWRELREGRTTAGERREKTSAEERREAGVPRPRKSGCGKGGVWRVVAAGTIRDRKRKGKSGGNAAEKRWCGQKAVREWGTSMAGSQPAQEKALSAGEKLRNLGEFLSFQTKECP